MALALMEPAEMPERGEDVTPAELWRWLNALRTDLSKDLDSLGQRIDSLKFVSPEVYAADKVHQDQQMAELRALVKEERDARRRVTLLAWTGFLLPILTGIITGIAVLAVSR